MLNPQLIDRIGWTLVHSTWQLAVVAYVVAVCNRFMFPASPRARYFVGCAALLTMTVAPVVSFSLLPRVATEIASETAADREPVDSLDPPSKTNLDRARHGDESPRRAIAIRPLDHSSPDADRISQSHARSGSLSPRVPVGSGASPPEDRAIQSRIANVLKTTRHRLETWLQPAMLSIVVVWFMGVLLLTARPLFGLYTVRRLRTVGRSNVPDKVSTIVRRLSRRIGLRRTVEVAQSTLLEVPAVVGCLRPLLLLPATVLTGLTPQQLEAVIAHELAHVRRHDYVVNLLQTIVETLLFYHPAVWWVSGVVRHERENCCDDLAVSLGTDRVAYAKTLVVLDELRAFLPHPAVAANGGSLLQRIRRLIDRDQSPRSHAAWLAGAFLLIALLMIDFTFAFSGGRVYPPRSYGRAGIVVPPNGEEHVIELAWHEFVRDGIWTSRHESDAAPWPTAEPQAGRLWIQLSVGRSSAPPIQVSLPELLLKRQHDDLSRTGVTPGQESGRDPAEADGKPSTPSVIRDDELDRQEQSIATGGEPHEPSPPVAGDEWFRDAPYPEIGYFQPDELDRTYVRMMMHAAALEELDTSSTQRAVLRRLGTWAGQDFYDLTPADREGRRAVWAKARARGEALLGERQRLRLKQLVIQQRRHEVFMNPKLLPELEITDEQLGKIRERWREHLDRIPIRGTGFQRAGHLSYRRFWGDVREILTAEQLARFEELRGPPAGDRGQHADAHSDPEVLTSA